MNVCSIFTEAEGIKLRIAYEMGKTVKELAEQHYCSEATVKLAIKKAGGKLRGASPKQYNEKEVRNDWNSGMTVDSIIQKHGFPSEHAVYYHISTRRKEKKYRYIYRNGLGE